MLHAPSRRALRTGAVLLLLASVAPAAQSVAFIDANVLPMTLDGAPDGRVLRAHTVVVEDGVVVAVGPTAEIDVPDVATRIDASDRYLVPGFQDLHIHFLDAGDLLVYLANGVTSVRNLSGTTRHLELREGIESGRLTGPRFVTSGPFTNLPHIVTPDDAIAAVEEHRELGYDCIKIHGELRLETYEALLDAADEAGIPVVGHAPRNLPVETVLALGRQLDVSHGEEYLYTYFDRSDVGRTDEAIERVVLATKEAGIAVVPNLIAYALIVRQVRDLEQELSYDKLAFVPPVARVIFGAKYNRYRRDFSAADLPGLERSFAFLQRFTLALATASVPLAVGSDAMNPTVAAGSSVHEELELLVASGLTPYQALRAATCDAGATLFGEDGPGSIAAGRPADLVLLDANPLDDIANARRIAGVMTRGTWIERAELDARMESLRSLYDIEWAFTSLVEIDDFQTAAAFYGKQKASDPSAFVVREDGLEAVVVLYLQAGRPDMAVEAGEFFVAAYPESWRAHARFGDALLALGDVEYARECYATAVDLAPEVTTLTAVAARLAE